MSSPAATDYAASNRERKCNAMVQYFLGQLINRVHNQDKDDWRKAAEYAGVNEPSDASKHLIADKLLTLLEIQRVLGRQA